MFRNRFVRRALIPVLAAGAAATTIGVSTAGAAQVYPRVSSYHLTAAEYLNLCGPYGAYAGQGVIQIDGGAGMSPNGATVNCYSGDVAYTSVSNF